MTCRANADLDTANMFSEVKIVSFSGSGDMNADLLVRWTTPAADGYGFEGGNNSANQRIFRQDNDATLSSASGTFSAGDVIYLSADGSTITAKVNGTTRLGPITDTTFSTQKRGGMGMYIANVGAAVVLDSYRSGDIVANAPGYVGEFHTTFTNDSVASKTTATFDVRAGDLLVAYYAYPSPDATDPPISGGSLTWTIVQQISNVSGYPDIKTWQAVVDSNKSMSVTFTAPFVQCFGGGVYIFRGAEIGSSVKENQTNEAGGPALDIITTKTDSILIAVFNDYWGITGTPVWRTGAGSFVQDINGPGLSSNCSFAYVGRHTDVTATGTYTVGMTSPTGQHQSFIVIEVRLITPAAPMQPPDSLVRMAMPMWIPVG